MHIPDKLLLGGVEWTVEQKPLRDIDSECNGGWCMWEDCKIVIADDVPEDRQAEIFIHELLHAVNVYLPEKEVEFLAASLYQVLKTNNLYFSQQAPSGACFVYEK